VSLDIPNLVASPLRNGHTSWEGLPPRARPFRAVKNLKPLLFHGGALYCARFTRVFKTTDFGEHLTPVADLVLDRKVLRPLAVSPLLQRVLRAAVYRMRVLPGGGMVFVFRKGVYVLEPGSSEAHCTFRVRRGTRPVSLAVSPDGLVVFGEYFSNPERDEVYIYGSRDAGRSWEVVYTFPKRSIRHVHGVTYDPYDDCFWVTTGDRDGECRLLRAGRDFGSLDLVCCAGQGSRFYSVHTGQDRLVMATDTPLAPNYIVVFDKRTGRLERRQQIENSSFYHCEVGGRLYLSTNAEPSALNDMSASHVWSGSTAGDGWERRLSISVDFWTRVARFPGLPSGLFQYPRVFFPEGPNPTGVLVCYGVGLRGWDDTMLCFDTETWRGDR
jgi:hypothetical protein